MTRTSFVSSVPRLVIIAALALALTGTAIIIAPRAHDHATVSAASRGDREAFRQDMRRLWEDHIVWTRMVIVSAVADLPDLDHAVDRLLQNQDDIGGAIRPFYGDAAADELSRLLREHITGAAVLLAAAKSGDTDATNAAAAAWYVNADEIGGFLADANPRQWDRAEMQAMMRHHLDLTLAEAQARLRGDWTADVTAYDEIHVQILHMADMLSDGIIAQFPAGFGR